MNDKKIKKKKKKKLLLRSDGSTLMMSVLCVRNSGDDVISSWRIGGSSRKAE